MQLSILRQRLPSGATATEETKPVKPSTSASDQPSGPFAIVTRDDGSRQWSYKGKPIYTYQSDRKPGERTGDNFKDVWHVIKE